MTRAGENWVTLDTSGGESIRSPCRSPPSSTPSGGSACRTCRDRSTRKPRSPSSCAFSKSLMPGTPCRSTSPMRCPRPSCNPGRKIPPLWLRAVSRAVLHPAAPLEPQAQLISAHDRMPDGSEAGPFRVGLPAQHAVATHPGGLSTRCPEVSNTSSQWPQTFS